MPSKVTHPILVSGSFDDLRSPQILFLEKASKLGQLTVLLWSDELTRRLQGNRPKFPEAERRYFLEALRWVECVQLVTSLPDGNSLPEATARTGGTWVVPESEDDAEKRAFCLKTHLGYRVLRNSDLDGFAEAGGRALEVPTGRKKVIVTGCYDWLHTGHIRFFEEVSAYGDLYVVLGNDVNIRLLKGEGHPLLGQEERRYVVGSIRHVRQALIATGSGWIDADPEIQRLRPDIYAVNEDGDRGGKREYCAAQGMEYLVLKRAPAAGLPRRSSTDLRGF
jgi:cytidyltransferase-like protein